MKLMFEDTKEEAYIMPIVFMWQEILYDSTYVMIVRFNELE